MSDRPRTPEEEEDFASALTHVVFASGDELRSLREQLAAVTREREVLEIKEAALFGLYEKASRELAAANLALDGMSRAALENAERLAAVTRERDELKTEVEDYAAEEATKRGLGGDYVAMIEANNRALDLLQQVGKLREQLSESHAREAALREALREWHPRDCNKDQWCKCARCIALSQPAQLVVPVEVAEALAEGIETALKGILAEAPEWEVTEALHSTLAAHRAKHPRTKQTSALIHYTTEAFTTEDDPLTPRTTTCGLSFSPASGLITRNRANVTCTQCQP